MPRPRAPDGIMRPSWPAKAPAAKLDALIPLARQIAGSVAARVPARLAEDIRAAALVGAWLVVLRHPDDAEPEHLRRYAIRRIKGACLDELRRQDFAPRRLRAAGLAPDTVYLEDFKHGAERGRVPEFASGALAAALSAAPTVESDLDYLARVDRLYAAWSGLPERDRLILLEVEVRERRPVEIARELGVSEARISQLRTRAKRRLREAMGALP